MTKIEIENIEYNVPQTFDEVTIDQFAKIVILAESEKDGLTLNKQIIKILTGVDIGDLPHEVGVTILSLMPFLNDMSVINDQNPFNESHFIHNGVAYNVPKVINNITFDQYWCLDKILEVYKGNQVLNQAALIIALICLKDGEKFNYDTCKSREEEFKQIPCILACQLINGFFLQSRISNVTTMLCSMAEEELESQLELLTKSIENGSGTRLSGLFVRSYLKLLKRPGKGRLVTYLSIWLGKKIWRNYGKLNPKVKKKNHEHK